MGHAWVGSDLDLVVTYGSDAASLNVAATAAAGEPRQPAASLPLRFSNQISTKGVEETPNRDYTPVASKDRLTVVHRGLGAPSVSDITSQRVFSPLLLS
ncbi:hypothetical protein V6N13_097247 [Hibiscus sabdariffa]|uniref:Uncharacterized protein n=1 Tax=Hibiscus sabdariffa TaxID=183260 RepID=A0ABR2AZ47_9ROSI